MKIYVLPDRNVQIHGIKDQYNYGDNISLVCKAGKSWPPIQLVWLINGLTIDPKYVVNMTNVRSTSSLIASRIGLNMQAKPHYFRSGVLEIKCIATLILVYEYEAIENLVTGSSRNKKNLEWSLQPNIRTPVIVGMKQNYRLDENLNINCTSSIENAKLKWFINFNEANQSDLIQYRTEPNRFILGLWIRMDKHLLQMTELKLRCISLFFKQINQFNSTLKIRTFDQRNDGNHFGEESEWHHNEAKDIPLISAKLIIIIAIVPNIALTALCTVLN
ncbi:hypothetical protein SSS_06551 [Sarcoptes scabiei]|uniref:CD80-like immunoglobulin C2-set domain-containing protein n=1 Tax=Sarcoptes scabiei TaxID=52283 RepID=A0A834R291_SARSC|nr:hypothetical protein SSS_06551 [Sarcoptes scabiei]